MNDCMTAVAISPDGRYVAAGSLDKSIFVWEIETGLLVQTSEGHLDSVYGIAFSPDSQQVISASLDLTLKIWKLSPDNVSSSEQKPTKEDCTHTLKGHKVRQRFILNEADNVQDEL